MEEDEGEESADVDRIATYVGYFGHGCLGEERRSALTKEWGILGTYPNHRAEGIADDEEGEPEEGVDGRDVEVGLDTLEPGGVDGGADVDRGCEKADLECNKELFGGRPILRILRIVGSPVDEEMVSAFFLICDWGIRRIRDSAILVVCLRSVTVQ